jgi:hypothetical protein
MLQICLPGILAWGLGIPVTLITILQLSKKRSTEQFASFTLFYLTTSYKPRFRHWELVVLAKKSMVAITCTVLLMQSDGLKSTTAFLVVFVYIILQLKAWPYSN